jgi:hypothetical protein
MTTRRMRTCLEHVLALNLELFRHGRVEGWCSRRRMQVPTNRTWELRCLTRTIIDLALEVLGLRGHCEAYGDDFLAVHVSNAQ